MGKKRPSPASAPASMGDALDRRLAAERSELVRSGRAKLAVGQTPSREEARAIQAAEKEAVERYGEQRVAKFPKGEFAARVGRAPKVLIDLFRRLGVKSYFEKRATVDRDALDYELVEALLEHSSAIERARRSKRLRASGDADPDELDYDEWDARRVRAIALDKEFELDKKVAGWVPVEVLRPLLREVLETDIRGMIDDYDKRDHCTPTEVAARGRLMLERIGERIQEAIADGSGGEEHAA